MRLYWLGLATLPALAAAYALTVIAGARIAAALVATTDFTIHRIKPDAPVIQRRLRAAAIYGAPRGLVIAKGRFRPCGDLRAGQGGLLLGLRTTRDTASEDHAGGSVGPYPGGRPMSRAWQEEIAEVLRAHRYHDVLGDYEIAPYYRHVGCSCGWERNIVGMAGYWSWLAAHEAHVAEAMAAKVAELLGSEETREAVVLGIAGTQKPCRKAIEANGSCVSTTGAPSCYCADEADAALGVLLERCGGGA
jgi:hypothetical protein